MKSIMKNIFALCFLLSGIAFCNITIVSSVENTDEGADSTFLKTHDMPMPIGGMEAIMKNVRYPEEAKKAGKEGKVIVMAEVDESGKIVNVSVKKSVDKFLDEAAKEAVSKVMFTPGKVSGKPVKVKVAIPIMFKLDGEKDKQTDETLPYPVGGMQSIMKAVTYPEDAKTANIQGTVLVSASVNEQGNVVETKILKSVSSSCDAEAARAVKSVKFIPAKVNGKYVRAEIVVPIMFKLQ